MSVKEILKECRVFSELTNDELEKIVPWAKEKEYEAGTIIFREAETAKEFFVLEGGKVALQMSLPMMQVRTSRSTTIEVVSKNEVFGWSALVEPYIYRLASVCLQNVKVLSIDGMALRSIMHDNERIGHNLLRELIKVVASRLEETRALLISESALSPCAEGSMSK